MREQIWNQLFDAKFKSYCISLKIDALQKLDRDINVYVALASSGSIAAWAIWKDFPLLWAIIIAASQVFTVVKPYFPYNKYIKELNAKCSKIDNVVIDLEQLWYKLQNQKITIDEASNDYFLIRRQINEILIFSDDIIFTIGEDIEKKANARMAVYSKNTFGVSLISNL